MQIPHSILIKKNSRHSKTKCNKCNKTKRVRFLALFKGKILCSDCKPHKI